LVLNTLCLETKKLCQVSLRETYAKPQYNYFVGKPHNFGGVVQARGALSTPATVAKMAAA